MNQEKLRILLLNVSSMSFFYDQLVIPFGLISLASYIDSEDYLIKGIEMNSSPKKIPHRYLKVDKYLLKEIKSFYPDVIAMSTYSSNIYNVLFWADIIKAELPDCFILIGGNHASYIARECLEKCSSIDIIVRFEGEIPFQMICEKIKSKVYDFSKVPNISYREKGIIKENPQIGLIKDINNFPILNRDFFRDETKQINEITHADIISARGCPFNCTFCNCNHFWNKRYRVRMIESVIEELKNLKNRYPNLKSVRFRDETISIIKQRCILLCDELRKNNFNLEFQAHSRLDGLDEILIKNLKIAGFKQLYIGLESGSKRILNNLNKGIDISRTEYVIKTLRKYGIKFRVSFIFLSRDEKLRDIVETIKLIKRLKLKKIECATNYGISIYPGTKECEIFLKLNPGYEWLLKDYNYKGNYKASKDLKGNILHPKYQEGGYFKSFFYKSIILILTNPFKFLEMIKFELILLFDSFLKFVKLRR